MMITGVIETFAICHLSFSLAVIFIIRPFGISVFVYQSSELIYMRITNFLFGLS